MLLRKPSALDCRVVTDPTSSKSALGRLADLADGLSVRLARAIEDSPTQQLTQATEDSATHLMRSLENESIIRLNKQFEEATRIARMLEQQRPAVMAFLDKVEEIQRTFQNPAVIDGLTRFQQQASAIGRALESAGQALESAVLPTVSAITSVSAQLARAIEPYQGAFASISAWEANLVTRMMAVETAWALPDHLGQSMLGFARLSRLSEAVHTSEPFSEPVGDLVSGELGVGADADGAPIARDAAAVDAGLNPDLIAFPPAAYDRVLFAAGFEFRFAGAPVPQAVEAADHGAVFDPMHGLVLTEVEQRLRQLVEKRLQNLNGQKWISQRVSEAVRKRWMERQAEERAAGRPIYALVQYADFIDLADVIVQTNNWREAFESIFRNRDDFTVSLRRLHPVRKAVAHGRPLGRADFLTLVSEATRILGALGVRVLGES
jgi:hypothetical protein